MNSRIEIKKNRGILYFSAPWCEPCKQLGPVMDNLAREGIPVKKINIDYDATNVERYKIQSVPTLVLVDGTNNEIKRSVGGGDREGIINWFNS